MHLRTLTLVFTLMISINCAFAGFDSQVPKTKIISIYRFENKKDTGPYGDKSSVFYKNTSVVKEGKVGKSLQIKSKGAVRNRYNAAVDLAEDEFSVVAWIKTVKQTTGFGITMFAHKEDHFTGDLTGALGIDFNAEGNVSGVSGLHPNVTTVRSNQISVFDNKWHHVVFTRYANNYFLFLDGQVAKKKRVEEQIEFSGKKFSISMVPVGGKPLVGPIYIDEVAFFKRGFSLYEIRALRNAKTGLEKFVEVMSVEPKKKLTVQWGTLKTYLP